MVPPEDTLTHPIRDLEAAPGHEVASPLIPHVSMFLTAGSGRTGGTGSSLRGLQNPTG